MDDSELRELQDPENWEDDGAGLRPPVKMPRAVVSVAFSRDDLSRVSESARRSGMKTSEFIRHAALEQTEAQIRPRVTFIQSVSRAQQVEIAFRTPSESRSAGRIRQTGESAVIEKSFVTA